MIYDIHTHYWLRDEIDLDRFGDEFVRKNEHLFNLMSSDAHLKATKATVKSVVFGLRAPLSGFNVSNDTVKAQVDRALDRLVFFTSIDPSEDGYMDELERTHMDMGARGIKIGPLYQGLHPLDPRYHEIFRYAARHGLPVITHMATTFVGAAPLEYARPAHMEVMAQRFPDVKIVMAHLGHPWEGETISCVRRYSNLYTDISALYYRPWQFYNAMRLAVEYNVTDRILFGSDFPFTTPQTSLKGIRNMNHIIRGSGLPPISDDVIEGIINRNSFVELGLE